MFSFSSWFDISVKLALLLFYAAALWIYGSKFSLKLFPFPLFLAASLPFFITYKAAIALGKGSMLNALYTVIALLGGITFSALVFRQSAGLRTVVYQCTDLFRQHRIFAGVLVSILTLFCLRGLYLEYPGDAITYLQRVGQANQDSSFNISSVWRYNPSNTFFNSFQQWLVGSDELLRAKLRLVAAISACALSLATYRLTLWNVHHKISGILAIFLCLGFYGNLQISFFLYKILQGATLAMIVYLEVIPVLHRFLANPQSRRFFTRSKVLELLTISMAAWICLDCHKEKVFYLFTVAFAYASFSVVKYVSNKKRPPILVTSVLFLASAFLVSLLVSDKPPLTGYHLPLVSTWFTFGKGTVFNYWPIPANSSLIWLDLIVIGLAVVVLNSYSPSSKEFFMAAISIAPFFLFINPIAITGLIKLTSADNLYRLMIGGLPWVFLPLACEALERDKAIKIRYIPIVFAFLGLLAYAPIYGKLPHIFNRVPAYANGQDLTSIVKHLLNATDHSENGSLNIMATPYVNSYLAAWPSFGVASDRWIANDVAIYGAVGAELAYFYSPEITASEITEAVDARALDVIVIDHRDDLTYQSWLGRMTQHWAPDLIASQQKLFAGQSLRSYLESQPQPLFELTLEKNGFQVYQKLPHSL